MQTDIKTQIVGLYIEYPDNTSDQELGVEVGETYQDFLDNKLVALSDEQVSFHKNNPKASIWNVINMTLALPDNPLFEDVLTFKLAAIKNYDESSNVNSFYITVNGNTSSAWFTPEIRSNYKNSIEAAELVGVNTLSFYVNNMAITLSTAAAKLMLAQIQLYADRCYMVTKQHENALKAMSTVEEVQTFDITQGYPEKLTFTV